MNKRLKKPVTVGVCSIVLGISPLALAFLASSFASLNNCQLHEGFANPCHVLGIDIGGFLYSLFVLGWFTLLSIPLGAVGLLISVVWFLVVYNKDR